VLGAATSGLPGLRSNVPQELITTIRIQVPRVDTPELTRTCHPPQERMVKPSELDWWCSIGSFNEAARFRPQK
jgi:hypothetical protein